MLFDERPKDNLKDLFGREEEVAKFERAIQMKSPDHNIRTSESWKDVTSQDHD